MKKLAAFVFASILFGVTPALADFHKGDIVGTHGVCRSASAMTQIAKEITSDDAAEVKKAKLLALLQKGQCALFEENLQIKLVKIVGMVGADRAIWQVELPDGTKAYAMEQRTGRDS